MTERQHNRELLGEKLSQLPVPPNEALWSRIEAQLLVVPPVVQHPSAKALQHKKWLKAIGVKTVITIVSTILLIVFIIWLVNRKPHSQPATSAPQKAIAPIVDSVRKDTVSLMRVQQKDEQVKVAPPPAIQVPVQDTQTEYTPVTLNRKAVDFFLRDTTTPTVTSPVHLHADSIKPLPTKKKDEGYYFEIKKKEKN